jgi:hypothetical protein
LQVAAYMMVTAANNSERSAPLQYIAEFSPSLNSSHRVARPGRCYAVSV